MLGSLIRVTSLATSGVNRVASLQAQLGGLFLVGFADTGRPTANVSRPFKDILAIIKHYQSGVNFTLLH